MVSKWCEMDFVTIHSIVDPQAKTQILALVSIYQGPILGVSLFFHQPSEAITPNPVKGNSRTSGSKIAPFFFPGEGTLACFPPHLPPNPITLKTPNPSGPLPPPRPGEGTPEKELVRHFGASGSEPRGGPDHGVHLVVPAPGLHRRHHRGGVPLGAVVVGASLTGPDWAEVQ